MNQSLKALILYPSTIDPEDYDSDLASTWDKMRKRGQVRPIWLTEFGCYADDDPFLTPGRIGDAAMSRAQWPDERAASEALVQTAAVFLSHGVEKIFFHAGTCGRINGSDGGGVFFEYGGAPRKMFAAVAILAGMLGPGAKPITVSAASPEPLRCYPFETAEGAVAIMWQREDAPMTMALPEGIKALDITGNGIPSPLRLSDSPVYLMANDRAHLIQAISELEFD